MPWPKDHKSLTRERILQAAAGAFRARGVSGVRVEEIMASAGLTHGGFYSHFDSKNDLLGEALEHAAAQTMESFDKSLDSVPAEHRILAMIEAYLSSAHAAHPDCGCPVAALGPELVRADKKTRERLARAVKRRIEWMRSLQPPQRREQVPEASLIGATACMIGGLILARSVDRKDSDAILQACREFLRTALQGEPSKASSLPQSESQSSERQGGHDLKDSKVTKAEKARPDSRMSRGRNRKSGT